jgi:hypothetical protein
MPGRTRGSCAKKAHEVVTTGSTGSIRLSPRDGFTVSFGLSLVIGLVVTIPGVKRELHRRVSLSVEMPGPHDFAVHEKCRSSFDTFASIAARTNVRDDREAPLFKRRGPAETSGGDLPDGASEIFERRCGRLSKSSMAPAA